MILELLPARRAMEGWFRIDAGRRLPVQSQPAVIRYFHVPGASVKPAAVPRTDASRGQNALFTPPAFSLGPEAPASHTAARS